MKKVASILLVSVLVLAALWSCGVDQLILNNATEKGPDWVPDAPDPYHVRGQVFGLPGGTVEYFAPSGAPLPAYTSTIKNSGEFLTQFPGTTAYRNLVVVASDGPTRLLGLAVRLPRNKSIYHDVQLMAEAYHLGGMTWGDAEKVYLNLDQRATAITLALLKSAFDKGTTLGSASAKSTNDDGISVLAKLIRDESGPMYDLYLMTERLLAFSATSKKLPPVFLYPDPAGLFLNPEFVEAAHMDYTGDGVVDDGQPFALALRDAGALIKLKACETAGRMTVVFMLGINPGNRDGNCNPINPYQWASQNESKTVFITGGMIVDDGDHTTQVCDSDADKQADCLTPAEWAEVNSTLGAWVPNQIALRDDGQGGDLEAGDKVWTGVFDLPYISTGEGAHGVRIGYKYTYGQKGQGWTSTEEWPGNNRILEVEDVNTDALVVRYDYFADETSNKNKDNVNKALAGSSRNPWPDEVKAGGYSDALENRIDTDQDCMADSYPSAGAVFPNCGVEDIPGLRELADDEYLGLAPDKSPVLQAVLPANGPNGGGFLVELKGANFHPTTVSTIEMNSVDGAPVSVTSNALPGYLIPRPTQLLMIAPHFPTESAKIVVIDGLGTAASTQFQYTDGGTVDCSLAYPAAMPDAAAGIPAGVKSFETHPVFARLAVTDPQYLPDLLVQLGVSPPCCNDGEVCLEGYGLCSGLSDPRYESGWSFGDMEYDAGCLLPDENLAACEVGESQFTGTIVPTASLGRYLYAVRYSMDYGQSWDYCDLPTEGGQPGNSNGYKWKDAGQLWVE